MEKYVLDSAENKTFVREIRNNLLSFGHQFPSPGGGSYYLGDDGTPWKDRPRETWITSRMCHVYSLGAMLGHEGSEALADAALKGLTGELHDDEHGGWYAGLTADGDILPDKQCYAHAFVILASSSAMLAGRPGAEELFEEATETFLQHFLEMTSAPLPRNSDHGEVDPFSEDFSAFVFKIQANMNKNHRDRIAFMRICSGKFTAGMEAYHVQGKKTVRLSQPQQMMADSRKMVEEAYAGDIIGIFDPGIYSIGDTLTVSKDKFKFEGIPTFAPEHFARCRLVDSMKRKQFVKGVNQIAQEGAIQMFQEYKGNMEEIIVGVVGVLQFDVLKFRLQSEYNVEIILENLPYEYIRWIKNPDEIDVDSISGTSDMKKVLDMKGHPLLLWVNEWSINMTKDRNKGLELEEFSRN